MAKKSHNHRLQANPAWHREERKGHKVGIIQAVKVQYRYIVLFPFEMNKLCSDKKIRLRFDWILAQPY